MSTKPKPENISWLRFMAIIVMFYFFLLFLALVFEAISKPALAYDQKQKQNQTIKATSDVSDKKIN